MFVFLVSCILHHLTRLLSFSRSFFIHTGAYTSDPFQTRCTFRPVCGCPTSIPALNMKVSGPGHVFEPVVLTREEMVVDKTSTADIQIMPTLKGDSTLRIYTVFKGSDDSFTAGDYVTFNAELVNALIDKHANYSDTENYLKCDDRGKTVMVLVVHRPASDGIHLCPSDAYMSLFFLLQRFC